MIIFYQKKTTNRKCRRTDSLVDEQCELGLDHQGLDWNCSRINDACVKRLKTDFSRFLNRHTYINSNNVKSQHKIDHNDPLVRGRVQRK